MKSYQKVVGVAMGALLLSAPLLQSATPILAAVADTTDPATPSGETATPEQLDKVAQLMQKAQVKVDASAQTSYLSSPIPSVQSLMDAIENGKNATENKTVERVQGSTNMLMQAIQNYDAPNGNQPEMTNYEAEMAAVNRASTTWTKFIELKRQNQTGALAPFEELVSKKITEGMWNGVEGESSEIFIVDMNLIDSVLPPMFPAIQSDIALQAAVDAGQKAIDSGQFTEAQLAPLKQALADVKNVTSQTWDGDDLATIGTGYPKLADPVTQAINNALPKPAQPGNSQNSVASSQAITALQESMAMFASNIPMNAPANLNTAVVAIKTALAKKGVGYTDADLATLSYALNKAYGQYVDTTATKLDGVGQVSTQGAGISLYQQPAGAPVLTKDEKTRTLPDRSAWKIFSTIHLTDGTTWYNVGKNQWINANYVLLEKSQVVRITVQNGAKLWQLNQEVFGDTNRSLGYHTTWKSFGRMIVDNQIYYNLGANQWVNAHDVVIEN